MNMGVSLKKYLYYSSITPQSPALYLHCRARKSKTENKHIYFHVSEEDKLYTNTKHFNMWMLSSQQRLSIAKVLLLKHVFISIIISARLSVKVIEGSTALCIFNLVNNLLDL